MNRPFLYNGNRTAGGSYMKLVKRLASGVLGIAMAVAMNPISVYANSEKSNSDFDDFMKSEFVETMENDYTTLHFYVTDLDAYGIQKGDVNIGKIEDKDTIVSENQESLDKLHKFDYDSLSDTQKEDYKEYEIQLEAAIDQAQYLDLEMLFEPSSDVASNIVTNMTEFVLRSKEDAQDYITVSKSIPDYMDQAIKITQEQSAKGIFLTDTMLDEIEEWLDGFTAKTTDNALIIIYSNRLKAASFLSDEEKTSLDAENQKVVLEQIIPAYQKVRDSLEALRGTRKYGDSVYDLPNGAAYYQAALKGKASSDKTTQELLDISASYLKETIKKLSLLQNSMSSSAQNEKVSLTTPEEVLSYLEKQLGNEFPTLSSFTYHAEYLDASVATDSIVAYYMQCPVDDAASNSIKINGSNISDENNLYETLAHEGIAGHMYQRNYYMSTKPNELRLVMDTLGYTEGWAMYAENQMWNYSGLSASAASYHQLETAFGYTFDAAVDLMVNGLGYSDSKVQSYFKDLGINSTYVASTIEYVKEYPLLLVPYGVGLSYFSQLREEAENALGSKFNATEFNTVLLNNGSRSFNLVANDVQKYIEAQGGTASADSALKPTEDDVQAASDEKKTTNWVLFGSIGAGLAAIGIIAFIAGRKFRKDDPFGA